MPVGVPNTFVAGTIIQSAEVNANFQALVTYINGLSIPTTPVSIANGGTGATTAAAALKDLGLATGVIIPCSASETTVGSVTTISLVGSAAAPAVTTYQEGTTYIFNAPASSGGTFAIQDTTTSGSGLGSPFLYDTPGTSLTSTLTAGQLALVSYSPAANSGAGGFVLVNTPAPSSAGPRSARFLTSGTLTVPTGITTMYATGCGAGGAGGGCTGMTSAGGGGGGGGASIDGQPFSVISGHLLAITVGTGATGGSGAGGTGGSTLIVDSTTATTIFTLNGGQGGAAGTTGSATTGGVGGGAGGLTGGQGGFYATAPISESGFGGGSLLGGGGSAQSSGGGTAVNGVTPSQYGGGGSGGAGNGAIGGSGANGKVLLYW
jgi:hypothetical protein